MAIKKSYQLGLKIKWILRAVVNALNAVVWSLNNFFPDPKAEDMYKEQETK